MNLLIEQALSTKGEPKEDLRAYCMKNSSQNTAGQKNDTYIPPGKKKHISRPYTLLSCEEQPTERQLPKLPSKTTAVFRRKETILVAPRPLPEVQPTERQLPKLHSWWSPQSESNSHSGFGLKTEIRFVREENAVICPDCKLPCSILSNIWLFGINNLLPQSYFPRRRQIHCKRYCPAIWFWLTVVAFTDLFQIFINGRGAEICSEFRPPFPSYETRALWLSYRNWL
jgi:hypothetical protein